MSEKGVSRSIFLFIVCALLMIISMGEGSADESVVIIANASVPEDSLSRGQLKDIFSGVEVVWKDGKEIRVVTLKDSPTHYAFTESIVNKTPAQFEAAFRKQVFLGQASEPEVFSSENEVLDYVGQTTGAIGYVSFTPQNESVKVINIID